MPYFWNLGKLLPCPWRISLSTFEKPHRLENTSNILAFRHSTLLLVVMLILILTLVNSSSSPFFHPPHPRCCCSAAAESGVNGSLSITSEREQLRQSGVPELWRPVINLDSRYDVNISTCLDYHWVPAIGLFAQSGSYDWFHRQHDSVQYHAPLYFWKTKLCFCQATSSALNVRRYDAVRIHHLPIDATFTIHFRHRGGEDWPYD